MLSGPRGDADLFPNLLWSICQPHHTAMSFLCTARTFHGATVNCLLGCPYPPHPVSSHCLDSGCAGIHTHTFHSYTHPGSFIKSLYAPVSLTEEREKSEHPFGSVRKQEEISERTAVLQRVSKEKMRIHRCYTA